MNIKKIFSFLNFGNLLVLFSKKEILKAEQDTASINHPVGDTTKALLFAGNHNPLSKDTTTDTDKVLSYPGLEKNRGKSEGKDNIRRDFK